MCACVLAWVCACVYMRDVFVCVCVYVCVCVCVCVCLCVCVQPSLWLQMTPVHPAGQSQPLLPLLQDPPLEQSSQVRLQSWPKVSSRHTDHRTEGTAHSPPKRVFICRMLRRAKWGLIVFTVLMSIDFYFGLSLYFTVVLSRVVQRFEFMNIYFFSYFSSSNFFRNQKW